MVSNFYLHGIIADVFILYSFFYVFIDLLFTPVVFSEVLYMPWNEHIVLIPQKFSM